MKNIIYYFILFFLSSSCKRDSSPFVNSVINSQWTVSYLDSNVHVSEGELLVRNDTIFHFFRLDSSNSHVSNNSSIAYRFSSNKGQSWSEPAIIYNSIYDDRNLIAKVINNSFLLIFRRYDERSGMKDLGFIKSNDLHNWSNYEIINTKLKDGQPFGEIINMTSDEYVFLTCEIGKAELFSFNGLVQNIDSKILYNYVDKMIDEPYLVKTSENSFFILARDEFHMFPNDSSYFLLFFENLNSNPVFISRTGMNNNQVNVNRSAPFIKYFNQFDKFFAVSVQRKYYTASQDSIFFYSSNLNRLKQSSKDWDLLFSITRPLPNKRTVTYGYPKIVAINNNEFLCIISERYNGGNTNSYFSNRENVAFFTLTFKII